MIYAFAIWLVLIFAWAYWPDIIRIYRSRSHR
jgi:hypothetical protein